MRKIHFAAVAALGTLALAGCQSNISPTDMDRAIIGAGSGYVVQQVRGKDGADRVRGAAIGAAAGALCNDVGFCQ